MSPNVKTFIKERLFIGFIIASLLVFIVGATGIVSVLSIFRSFERVENEVVGEIIILEELRSDLTLMLLEITTLLVLDLPDPESVDEQIDRAFHYGDSFKEGIDAYNRKIAKSNPARPSLELNEERIQSLVQLIANTKREGGSLAEILPYKKQLKALEETEIFPVIQANIDQAIQRLSQERAQNNLIVLATIVLIVGVGILSSALIIFLGLRITKREELVKQFREQLISIASHQLKAPITIMKGNAELLFGSKTIFGKDREMVHIMSESAENMNLLVNDLLDLSKIDQGQFIIEKKSVDVGALIRKIVKNLGPIAKDKKIKIEFQEPSAKLFVLTDAIRMEQALQNILNNGVKYNKTGGTLFIELKAEASRASLTVRDEGIGIPKKDISMIFERFYRASNARQGHVSGTGLGLFIAREIIQQSGGSISFNSQEGKGTTFYIQLPLKS